MVVDEAAAAAVLWTGCVGMLCLVWHAAVCTVTVVAHRNCPSKSFREARSKKHVEGATRCVGGADAEEGGVAARRLGDRRGDTAGRVIRGDSGSLGSSTGRDGGVTVLVAVPRGVLPLPERRVSAEAEAAAVVAAPLARPLAGPVMEERGMLGTAVMVAGEGAAVAPEDETVVPRGVVAIVLPAAAAARAEFAPSRAGCTGYTALREGGRVTGRSSDSVTALVRMMVTVEEPSLLLTTLLFPSLFECARVAFLSLSLLQRPQSQP